MQLPTYPDIEQLHGKYAPTPEVFDLVFTHCRIVHDIADQLIGSRKLAVDAELVRVGCLLHDIGVYRLFDTGGNAQIDGDYVTHGLRGEEILRAEGFNEEIWRFASHHTGVGLTKRDIVQQNLPLPVEDFLADTPEELLVMYADKFHSKTQPSYFNSNEWYGQYVIKFGEDKARKFAAMADQFGVPDLRPLATKYGHRIRRPE
jgi:uncharacterized protein